MDVTQALETARTYLNHHGLHDWKLQTSRGFSTFGVCYHQTKIITMSRHMIEANEWTGVEAVLLHEIAHALAGPAAGHGPRRRAMARKLGCPDTRCLGDDTTKAPAYKWVGECGNGHAVYRYRRSTKNACAKCCNKYNGGEWTADYLYTWKPYVVQTVDSHVTV